MIFKMISSIIILMAANTSQANMADFAPYSGEAEVSVRAYMRYWIPPQAISIEQATATENQANYQVLERISTPVSRQDIWYKLDIRSSVDSAFIFNFREIVFDEIDFYVRKGTQWEAFQTGRNRPYNSSPLNQPLYAFPLALQKDETANIYVRLSSTFPAIVDPVIQSQAEFNMFNFTHTALNTTLIGIMLGILIYLILVPSFAFSKIALCSFYVYVATTIAINMYYTGFDLMVFGESLTFGYVAYYDITIVHNIALLMFTQHVMAIPQRSVNLNYIFNAFIGVTAMLLIVSVLLGEPALLEWTNQINRAILILLFATSLWAMVRRLEIWPYYFAALSGYSTLIIILIVGYRGAYELGFWGRYMAVYAVTFLTIMLSVIISRSAYGYLRDRSSLEKDTAVALAKNETKSEFLAAMSHEIRTPINGVLGMAQMLQRTPQNETQRQYTDVILTAGRNLLNLLNDVLDFSKIEAGKLELDHTAFNFDNILSYTMTMFSGHANADKVELRFNFPPDIPLFLIGDGARLQQILNNFLSNALKFTEEGHVLLDVSVLQRNQGSALIRILVEDTGIGISEEKQQRLFGAYEQLGDINNASREGTGLGLNISKRLAELMNGSVGVFSTRGKGSQFYCDIPLDIDVPAQRQYEEAWLDLQDQRIVLAFKDVAYAQALSKTLQHWHIDTTLFPLHHTVAQEEITPYDAILLSNKDPQACKHWLQVAHDAKTPCIVFDSIAQAQIFDAYQPLPFQILRVPCGFLAIQQVLLEVAHKLQPDMSRKSFNYESKSLAGLDVLLVEDNPVNQQVMRALLGKLDANVVLAENGQQAVALYQDQQASFDVVLMDCSMPIMDGFEATQLIRAFEKRQHRPRIPIYALTAHAMNDIQERCKAAGMDDTLTKPLDLGRVNDLLASHHSHSMV